MKRGILLFIGFVLYISTAVSQTKSILYYDANGKGVENKKQCSYYREVTFDINKKPVGEIKDYLKSGKLQSIAENALHIDKLDDSKSVWAGNVIIYDKKGKKVQENNFSKFGQLHGKSIVYDDKEQFLVVEEFDNGLPVYNWYLQYIKGTPVKNSYVTHLPLNALTEDRIIYPVQYRRIAYDDGVAIQYYFDDGISIAVKFAQEDLYGKYYAAYITFENGTDDEIILDPNDFIVVSSKGGKISKEEIIPYQKYMKKVKRKQGWSSFFNAFAESQAANNAGYSASFTAAGAIAANNYGDVTIGYGESASASYSGSAQYAANQQARKNQQNFENSQYEIRNSIAQGYLKINTIMPKTRLIGYVNVKRSKIDNLVVNIPVNGKVYQFQW